MCCVCYIQYLCIMLHIHRINIIFSDSQTTTIKYENRVPHNSSYNESLQYASTWRVSLPGECFCVFPPQRRSINSSGIHCFFLKILEQTIAMNLILILTYQKQCQLNMVRKERKFPHLKNAVSEGGRFTPQKCTLKKKTVYGI